VSYEDGEGAWQRGHLPLGVSCVHKVYAAHQTFLTSVNRGQSYNSKPTRNIVENFMS